MDDKTTLTFIVREILSPSQYEIMAVNNKVLIKTHSNLTYLINCDINGMDHNVGNCHICGHIMNEESRGSIASGNGEVIGIMMCQNCRSIRICEFEEKSRKALANILNITEDMINQKWGEYTGSYIH